jgi:hypothetical protein
MATVVEEIPTELRPDVDAAVAWLNGERGHAFTVTGILDPDGALAQRSHQADAPLDLSLILCDGDLCVREQLRVQPTNGSFDVALATDAASEDPPAELDPLPGVRSAWLDDQLGVHEFIVLVFYRGFW